MKQKKPGYRIKYVLSAAIAAVTVTALVSCVNSRQIEEEVPVIDSGINNPETPVPEPTPTPTPVQEPESPEQTPEPAAEPTPEPTPATDITSALTVTISGAESAEILLDDDYTSKISFRQGESISIYADEEIYSVYLIWDKPPGLWVLESSEPYICGENGFIHEYITVTSPASVLNIQIPPDGAILCDIYAFTEGYPPGWVQTWNPPHEKADMLILPTHADDEHLFFVGAIPYYAAERGYNVQVAYMTNHWNEQPRPHELLNGLWTVGIRNYPVISGFNDRYTESLQDAQSKYGYNTIIDFHVGLLRRFKPSVVLGHDLNGEYGHGGHMLNAHALREAVERAADNEYHADSAEKYGIWDTPKLYLHLYNENAIIMDWDIPLESFDGATAREIAAKGYDCHISQHKWAFAVPPAGSTGSGSKFGLARTLVGPDITGGDMFENIEPIQELPLN